MRQMASFFLMSALGLFAIGGNALPLANGGEPHLTTRPQYTILPGDKVEVSFRYTPELNQAVTVQPDGYVTLATVGQIKLSGMTLTEAAKLITQKAEAHLKDPQVTLTLTQFHKPYFVVAGEVAHPGRYDMDEPTTALQAVLQAGGIVADGRSSQVIVFRRINEQDDEVRILNLHNIKKRADLEHDMMLDPGDMILVPRDNISKIDRVIHAVNAGAFFDPTNF